MSNRIVGVSIETTLIKAVEVRIWRGRATVARAGSIQLPAGAVDWGTIVDPAAVADGLQRLWAETGFRARRVALVMDSHHVLTRQTELPVLSEQSYLEAVRYDLAELLSYDPDEAVIDAIELDTRIGDSGLEHRQAIAVAVHEQSLLALKELADRAGLEVVRFDLGALALDRAVAPTERPSETPTGTPESPEPVLAAEALHHNGSTGAPDPAPPLDRARIDADVLVHVEADATTVVIRAERGIQFLRTITVGTGDQASAVASELEAHLETILAHDRVAAGSSVSVEYGQYRHPVSEAVGGTLEYLTTTNPAIRPTRVLLSGDEPFELLRAIVGAGTSLPVVPSQPTFRWAVEGCDPSGYLLETGTALSAGPDDSGVSLDLRTDRDRVSDTTSRQWQVGLVLAAAAVVAAVLQIGRQQAELDGARLDRVRAEAALVSTRRITDGLADTAAVRTRHAEATARLQLALGGDVDLVGVIDAVVEALPRGSSMSRLAIRAEPGESSAPLDEHLGQPVGVIDLEARTPSHVDTAEWLRSFEAAGHLDGEAISGSTQLAGDGALGSTFSARAVVAESARWERLGLYGGGPLDPGGESGDEGGS